MESHKHDESRSIMRSYILFGYVYMPEYAKNGGHQQQENYHLITE